MPTYTVGVKGGKMYRKGKHPSKWRKARRVNNNQNVVNRINVKNGLGFPRRMTMTHRYAQQGVLSTGTSGAMTNYSFRCNGLYDPDATGAGHQPMYFDQMTAIYNHYCVIASKITVTFCQADTTPTTTQTRIPLVCGVYLNDDSTVTPGINGLLENALMKTRNFTLNDGSPKTCRLGWSAKKTFGGSILGNSNLQGTATINPAEEQFFTLFLDSAAMLDATDVYYRVQIDYITVWTELKDIASS